MLLFGNFLKKKNTVKALQKRKAEVGKGNHDDLGCYLEKYIFRRKKKNLDGASGNIYYWHNLRMEHQNFFNRQMVGGSVMMWGVCI